MSATSCLACGARLHGARSQVRVTRRVARRLTQGRHSPTAADRFARDAAVCRSCARALGVPIIEDPDPTVPLAAGAAGVRP